MDTESDLIYKGGVPLTNPLKLRDLTGNGCRFEINNDEIDDEVVDDPDDDDDLLTDSPETASPWTKSFDELITAMKPIPGARMHKRIIREGEGEVLGELNARVSYHYSTYFEREQVAFDSTFIRNQPQEIVVSENSLLYGMLLALKTMRSKEKAEFIIGYELMYGKLGCPHRIKPEADCLVVIELLKFSEAGDSQALDNIAKEDRKRFAVVKVKADEVYKSAVDSFRNGRFGPANKQFDAAIKSLELCNLSSDEEQNVQQEFLIKLYRNQAVCYNKREMWAKTCCMIKDLTELSKSNRTYDFNLDCKAHFLWGKALLKLGEFKKARDKLVIAQRLEPHNKEVNNELMELDQKLEKYNENKKRFSQKAFGIIEKVKKEENDGVVDEDDAFAENLKDALMVFAKDDNMPSFTLPDGLSNEEITALRKLASELGLKLKVHHTHRDNNKMEYVLSKD